MNKNENKTVATLSEIFLLRQGRRNSRVYLHKINFPIELLRAKGRNRLPFDIYKQIFSEPRMPSKMLV